MTEVAVPVSSSERLLTWAFLFVQRNMEPDKAAAVCDRIAEGLSLRRACNEIGLNPPTFLAWCDKDAALNEQYAQARARGYQLLADELLEISDDSSGDTFTDDDGNVRTDAERVARSKLRVDTRKWMLSKMLPKIYGDKVVHAGDPDSPIDMNLTVSFR